MKNVVRIIILIVATLSCESAVAQTGSSSVRLTDGADVTKGAKADSAYAGSGSASAIAILKGIYTGIQGVITAINSSAITGFATAANQTTGNSSLSTIATNTGAATPAGTALIGNVGILYPAGSTAINASTTGTTAATTATLAGTSGKTTYLCSFAIRSNATAAVTGNATVTGTISTTLNYTHWTAPLASGIGLTEQIFNPCVPASASNTGIAVISPAPGSGGVVSVTASGYQL